VIFRRNPSDIQVKLRIFKNLNFHEKRSKKEQSPTKYYFYKRLRESSGTSESGSADRFNSQIPIITLLQNTKIILNKFHIFQHLSRAIIKPFILKLSEKL